MGKSIGVGASVGTSVGPTVGTATGVAVGVAVAVFPEPDLAVDVGLGICVDAALVAFNVGCVPTVGVVICTGGSAAGRTTEMVSIVTKKVKLKINVQSAAIDFCTNVSC